MKKDIKKFGFSLVKESQTIYFKRRIKPRLRLLLILSVTVGPACAVIGFVVGDLNTALLITAGALLFLLVIVYLLWETKKHKLIIKNSDNIEWFVINRFKPASGSGKIEEFPKDNSGHRFKIKNWINEMPGARTIYGKPAYIYVYAVKKNGTGYQKIFSVETVSTYINDINNIILDHLPDSYFDPS